MAPEDRPFPRGAAAAQQTSERRSRLPWWGGRPHSYIPGWSLIWGGSSLHGLSWDQAWVCRRAGARTGWLLGAQPHLLLQVIDLRAQSLHHAVQLGDLHLGGAEVIPMPAGRPLQLLVLGEGGGQARGEMAMASQGPTGFQGAAWKCLLCPHCYFPSDTLCTVPWLSAPRSPCPQAPPHSWTHPVSGLSSFPLHIRYLFFFF